jgi:hypothetical protein
MSKLHKVAHILLFCVLMVVPAACAPQPTPETIIQHETVLHTAEVTRQVEVTREIPVTQEVTRLVDVPVTVTYTPTPQYTPTATLTPTITLVPSRTPTATPTPTYVVPRIKVLMHSQCRYGPGVAYLYKYGLLEGNIMEVLGKREILSQDKDGNWRPVTWLYLQAIGGNNPCWLNSELGTVTRGDLSQVRDLYALLPLSYLYGPPAAVSATREGNTVTISWSFVPVTEDDYKGYMVEAWICYQGHVYFTPVRSDELAITLPDEPGCFDVSSAKVYTAEKHGYSRGVPVPWPAFEVTSTPIP